MCQDIECITYTDHPHAGVSIALSTEKQEERRETFRQVDLNNYPAKAWIGKSTLNPRLPPLDPMEWELVNPELSLAADYHTDTGADGGSSTLLHPYITFVSYLDDPLEYPHIDQAKELMTRVCIGLTPIMKKEEWTVRHLTEFYPFEDCLRGGNHQQGQTVFLRLRDYTDKAVFLPFEEIMCTAIHELCHNRFSEHDGDFFQLWDDLNNWYGIPGGRALDSRLANPKQPVPVDQVGLLTRGKKIFLTTAELQKHFSAYADKFDSRIGFIRLPQNLFPSVVVRLAQLAKGFELADDKPLRQIPNARDYWDQETDSFRFFDDFDAARYNATYAIELYLRMYMTGEELGWHTSSRELVLERFRQALFWDCRLNNDPRWSEPKTLTCNAATLRLVEIVRVIYRATTVEEQPLRDIVVRLLKEVHKICQKGPFYFDARMLDEFVCSTPEVMDDLRRSADN